MGIERLTEFWPEWQITEKLGQGAYGTVYKAVDEEAGFPVYSAIKAIEIPLTEAEIDSLNSEGMTDAEIEIYFKGIVNDFVNEIKLMNELKGATNIVSVEAFKICEKADTIGWDIFIRMELLTSFKEYINTHTVTEDDIIALGINVASALEICHKNNIIHRDIKPANIFIDKFGNFKLGDFGIAKELGKNNGTLSSKGTFSYMAPEVAKGEHYDPTVDIYSLGLVLYSLCNNNRAPFISPNRPITYNERKEAIDRRIEGAPLPPPTYASTELANIILTACAYDPKKRFSNPTAFKNALINYKNNKNVSQITVPPQNTVMQVHSPFEAVIQPPPVDPQESAARNALNPEKTVSVRHVPIHKAEETDSPYYHTHTQRVRKAVYAGSSQKKPYFPTKTEADNQNEDKKTAIIAIIIAITVIFICIGTYFLVINRTSSGDGWTLSKNGVLTIQNEDGMNNFSFDYETGKTDAPWYKKRLYIKKIIIEDGITYIGCDAFSYCTSLESVVIPNSVTSIGTAAFFDCSSLREISLPDSVISIGMYAFEGCTSLENIVLSASLTTVSKEAFYGCSNLTRISFPYSVSFIGEQAFKGCSSLKEAIIPDTVRYIENNVFSDCQWLTIICPKDSVAADYAKDYGINVNYKIDEYYGASLNKET